MAREKDSNFLKIGKIGLWMEHFLQHDHNLPSYIRSMGLVIGKNIVGAYCLLVNKRVETYVELLSRIHLLTNQVGPGSIMTDFEQCIVEAIAQVYPLTVQKDVFFIYLKASTSGCKSWGYHISI